MGKNERQHQDIARAVKNGRIEAALDLYKKLDAYQLTVDNYSLLKLAMTKRRLYRYLLSNLYALNYFELTRRQSENSDFDAFVATQLKSLKARGDNPKLGYRELVMYFYIVRHLVFRFESCRDRADALLIAGKIRWLLSIPKLGDHCRERIDELLISAVQAQLANVCGIDIPQGRLLEQPPDWCLSYRETWNFAEKIEDGFIKANDWQGFLDHFNDPERNWRARKEEAKRLFPKIAKYGRMDMLNYLERNHLTPDEEIALIKLKECRAIEEAAVKGQAVMVNHLLAFLTPEQKRVFVHQPIWRVVGEGHEDVVERLLGCLSDDEIRERLTSSEHYVLILAGSSGNMRLLENLLERLRPKEKTAAVKARRFQLIQYAAGQGDLALIQKMESYLSSPEEKVRGALAGKYKAVRLAAERGHTEVALYLYGHLSFEKQGKALESGCGSLLRSAINNPQLHEHFLNNPVALKYFESEFAQSSNIDFDKFAAEKLDLLETLGEKPKLSNGDVLIYFYIVKHLFGHLEEYRSEAEVKEIARSISRLLAIRKLNEVCQEQGDELLDTLIKAKISALSQVTKVNNWCSFYQDREDVGSRGVLGMGAYGSV